MNNAHRRLLGRPVPNHNTSPGTTSDAGSVTIVPSRRTRAVVVPSRRSVYRLAGLSLLPNGYGDVDGNRNANDNDIERGPTRDQGQGAPMSIPFTGERTWSRTAFNELATRGERHHLAAVASPAVC